MLNLIKFISFYLNNIAKYELIDNKNTFSFLIIGFVGGLFLGSKILEAHLYVFPLNYIKGSLIIIGVLLVILFICCFYKIWVLKIVIIGIKFFISGVILLGVKAVNNKNVILLEELKFVYLTGKINYVKSHSDSHLKSLYLHDINIHNYVSYFNKNFPYGMKLITFSKVELKKGDIITVWAHLKPIYSLTPFEKHWETKAFWEKIGANGLVISKINCLPNNSLENNKKDDYFQSIREYFLHKIHNNMSPRVVGVAQAITLGDSSKLKAQDRHDLQKAGLGPFIAISGLHISIITAFIFLIIRKTLALIPPISLNYDSKKIAALITIIVISFYLLLLQNVPSALRASTMCILVMAGIIFRFYTLSIKNLLVAVFIILLFKPHYICSTSFIFSFTATAAVIGFLNCSLVKYINDKIKVRGSINILKLIFLTSGLSLIVSIAVLPLTVHYFQEVPLYGILTNIIITPLFSLIIMPFLFLSLILPFPLCRLFFNIPDECITFMLNLASFISKLNFSAWLLPSFSHNLLIIYIITLLLFIVTASKIKYVFLFICMFIIGNIIFTPLPNIMIDKEMKLLAFLDISTKKYVLNTLVEGKSIRNIWFKDKNRIYRKNILKNNIYENNNNIFIINKNPPIYFNFTLKQLILNKGNNSLIIDKVFLQKYGSSFIYLVKPNIIKVKSNTTNLYIYDHKYEK